MKFTLVKKGILIAILNCCFFSCSSDLDFEQAKDFNIQPVATTNLAYFNADSSDFISNGLEKPFFSYTANVDFLNTPFVKEDLIKAELYFRIKNTIPRAYSYYVTFLDINESAIYRIKMDIAAYNGDEVVLEKTETFAQENLAILQNTTKMVFSILMHSGTSITETTPGRVELSSSITAYFDVE